MRGAAIGFQIMAIVTYLPATFDYLLNASISRDSLSHLSAKWSQSPVLLLLRFGTLRCIWNRPDTRLARDDLFEQCDPRNCFIEHTRREFKCALH